MMIPQVFWKQFVKHLVIFDSVRLKQIFWGTEIYHLRADHISLLLGKY